MGFFYSQLVATRKFPAPNGLYVGKTIVITGSNTGLGKQAAYHYAHLGASRLIMAIRSPDKGTAAKKDIEAAAKSQTDIQVWSLDMSDYESVKKFAARAKAELDRIDIFHANAGMANMVYSAAEGIESMITVNAVSTTLLLGLMMPQLKRSAEKYGIRPVFGITTSGAHRYTKLPQMSEPHILDALGNKQYAEAHWGGQYPASKMVCIFIVRQLAQMHPNYPITVNLIDPGFCQSELSRNATGTAKIAFAVMKATIARSTEEGSRTLMCGGSAGPETHGQYLDNCKVGSPSPAVTENKDVQERIWREVMEKLDQIVPGISANFN